MTEKLKLPIGLENFEEIRKSGHPQSGRIFHKAKGKRSGCRTQLCKKLC